MGYTLCLLGVRVHGAPRSIADPASSNRMRDHGDRDNVGRTLQPQPAEPPAPLDVGPSQVGVPHAGDVHPYERHRERPDTALPIHRVCQARRKRKAPARDIQIARRRRGHPNHHRTKCRGGAAV